VMDKSNNGILACKCWMSSSIHKNKEVIFFLKKKGVRLSSIFKN
jgi:hypothetical protein